MKILIIFIKVDEWKKFMFDYNKYFQSNDDNWNDSFQQLILYIENNKKRPINSENEDINIKTLANWTSSQQTNYKNKKKIMSNKIIYNKWTEFINNAKYKQYFISSENIWHDTLETLIKYIDVNKKRPSENDDIILSRWTSSQQTNYRGKKHGMNDEIIYNKWTEFINNANY